MRPSQRSLILAAAAATLAITGANHLMAPEPLMLTDRDLDRWVEDPVVSAYDRGGEEAATDIERGELVIESFGLPAPAYYDWEDILDREYGIELRRAAGCMVTPEIEDHMRGYNEVMEAEIDRRFGAGLLERAWERAEREYESSVPNSPS